MTSARGTTWKSSLEARQKKDCNQNFLSAVAPYVGMLNDSGKRPHFCKKDEATVDDAELVQKAVAGDLDAYDELVRRYQSLITGLLTDSVPTGQSLRI